MKQVLLKKNDISSIFIKLSFLSWLINETAYIDIIGKNGTGKNEIKLAICIFYFLFRLCLYFDFPYNITLKNFK